MKQVRVTGLRSTVTDVNSWLWLKRVGGRLSALLKSPYILKRLDTGGDVAGKSDDGRAGRMGEATKVATRV